MYVCICNNVTETDIADAVKDGAWSLSCLKQRLLVSTCCGQCEDRAVDCMEKLLPPVITVVAPTTANPAVASLTP